MKYLSHAIPATATNRIVWRVLFTVMVGCLFALHSTAHGQSERNPPPDSQPTGAKRAYIICGHPGDDEHRVLFTESVESIQSSLTNRFGFAEQNVWLRFGNEDENVESPPTSRGPATKESLAADAGELAKLVQAEDQLWVFVIGHAHPGRRVVHLNLAGPDVTAAEFGQWFSDIDCRRSVYFVTTPLSGFFMRPLSKPNRVVIVATEADLELNETLFHSSLAKLMESFAADPSHDVDKDGTFSLLDLYLTVVRDVEQRYLEDDLLATEHAQLDDNGDGRGSELQMDFPLETESSLPRRQTLAVSRKDGDLAKAIDLGRELQKD